MPVCEVGVVPFSLISSIDGICLCWYSSVLTFQFDHWDEISNCTSPSTELSSIVETNCDGLADVVLGDKGHMAICLRAQLAWSRRFRSFRTFDLICLCWYSSVLTFQLDHRDEISNCTSPSTELSSSVETNCDGLADVVLGDKGRWQGNAPVGEVDVF